MGKIRMTAIVLLLSMSALGIAAAATAFIGAPATDDKPWVSASPPHPVHSDFGGYQSLSVLVDRSTHIVRGMVLKEDVATRDMGGRRPIPFVVSTVRVDRMLKGDSLEGHITIGQFGGGTDAAVAPGFEAVFFLKDTRDAAAWRGGPVLWEFHSTEGPQGRFALYQGRVHPLESGYAETTRKYTGMPVDRFVAEVQDLARRGHSENP